MSMRVRSKGEMFIDQIASALTEQMEERDSLRAENKRLTDSHKGLLAIENEASKLLGVADANGVDGIKYGDLTMLQVACNWTPNPVIPVLPVPADDPWDRKPGRKYIAIHNVFNQVVKGDVVEVSEPMKGRSDYLIRNLRTGQVYGGYALDQGSWRLPTAEENAKIWPCQYAPWGSKRKPFVRDGRWVAEPGDKFRHLRDRQVVVTVLDEPSDFTGLYNCKQVRDGKSQETHTYVLNENNWEPVS